MEIGIKNKDKAMADSLEIASDSIWKQKVSIFLINYFGYLALILSFIILAAGLLFYLYPQYQEIIKEAKATEENLKAELQAKADYLSDIRDLKNSYLSISQADRKKIEEMMPASRRVIDLIPEVESIVLKNGLILNSIKIESSLNSQSGAGGQPVGTPGQPAGIFEQLPAGVGLAKIEINVSSINYSILKNLLKTFENNLWLLDVSKINFDIGGKRANLIIYSYYLP
jgi:hypothetical protein